MSVTIKKSICHLCLAHCGINISIDNDRFCKIEPNINDPVSQGYICEKAQKLIGFQHSQDRILTPLKRTNGSFIPITWEQALTEISDKLKTISGDRIFYMASAVPDYRSIYNYELVKKLGSNYVSNVYSMEKIYPSMVNSMIFNAHIVCDTVNSQCHIIIGQNPWVTQHYPQARKVLNAIKNDPNRTMIVVDPCETETSRMSDQYLQIKPSTDAWFLSALIKIIIDNDYIDHKFIQTRTKNYDKVIKHFSKLDLDECLETCGMSYDQLLLVAKTINSSSSVSITTGNGICHSLHPFANNYLIILLYMITGNFQKFGGMNPDYNLVEPGMISDHYFIENHAPFSKEKQWGGVVPASVIIDQLHNFNCVIIENNNPVSRFPNSNKFKSQLSKIGLVVALDSFKTQSTYLADYVLPVPTFFESYEISSTMNKEFQLCEPIVKSKYKTVSEIFEILLTNLNLIDQTLIETSNELFNTDRMQFVEHLLEKYQSKIPEVYYTLQKVMGPKYKDPVITTLWWKFFLQTKKTIDTKQAIALTDRWIEKINQGECVISPFDNNISVIVDLASGYMLSTLKLSKAALTNDQFEFILQCGYRQKKSMNNVIQNNNESTVEINPKDMNKLALINGEQILLQTSTNELKLNCIENKNLPQGLIRMANHAIINQLSNDKNRDYLNPQYKMVFANIRKLNNGISQINN